MKENKFKQFIKNNVKVIILILSFIVISSIGITLAIIYYNNNVKVSTAAIGINYQGESNLNKGVSLEPVIDTDIDSIYNDVINNNTYSNKVITTKFSVQGNSTNTSGYVYNIVLDDLGTNCVMLSKDIKWNLYKNGNSIPISTGNLSPTEYDQSILNRSLILNDQKISLPASGSSKDEYVFILWLSESCTSDDITTCSKDNDQSKYLNHGISGSIKINAFKGNTSSNERTIATTNTCVERLGEIDESGANSPDLLNGMIPVYYDYNSESWKRADESNREEFYSWYDYDENNWANAVLVSSESREKYTSTEYVGKEVAMSDILAFYVWIPRYKYKLWNSTHLIQTVSNYSYNAYEKGVDIKFESGVNNTGSVECNIDSLGYEKCTTNGVECTSSGNCNDLYYTHPAFTLGDTELRGIWMGKFENSSEKNINTVITNTTTKIRILPNYYSWKGNTLANYFKVIKNIETDDTYGLNSNDADSHLAKNIDWGATVYLTHSKYGTCSSGTCSMVKKNSSDFIMTGCGPISTTSESKYTGCNNYNTELGQLASTTVNVSGIYDMNGGEWDYVSALALNDPTGDYANYPKSDVTGFCTSGYSDTVCSTSAIPFPEQKYYDIYDYKTSSVVNNTHLGDAIMEVKTGTGNNTSWESANTYAMHSAQGSLNRGGYASSGSSIFQAYGGSYGSGSLWLGSRSALTKRG